MAKGFLPFVGKTKVMLNLSNVSGLTGFYSEKLNYEHLLMSGLSVSATMTFIKYWKCFESNYFCENLFTLSPIKGPKTVSHLAHWVNRLVNLAG